MLEAFTVGGIQARRDGLRTIRWPRQALHTLPVKGRDDVAPGLDGTPHPWRNGLRRQPLGPGKDDWRTADTAGVCRASVGLSLPTFIVGQGAENDWGFHNPRMPREAPLQKNSRGDALGLRLIPRSRAYLGAITTQSGGIWDLHLLL